MYKYMIMTKLHPLRQIFIVILSIMCITLNARHIVGGEVYYECLGPGSIEGTQNYQITMTIYRDCAGGGAFFDNPAQVGLYQELGTDQWESIDVFNVFLEFQDTIDIMEDDCLDIPPGLCVELGRYSWTVENLPMTSTRYQLAYQRCCRNNTIVNIVDPQAAGAGYTAIIEMNAYDRCFSSGVFNEFPPVVICAGTPVDFDHSLNSPEADSIVYSFCAPIAAGGNRGSIDNPGDPSACDGIIPNASFCPPPYPNVEFVSPVYSADAPMAGNPIVSIDPETGLISGIPDVTGQFVIGVCAQEYIDGEYVGEVRRDFQFNVVACGAAFESISFKIDQGDSVVVNDETYTEQGSYVQNFTTSEGCDSFLTVNVLVVSEIVNYDFNDCRATGGNGQTADYGEFEPTYPNPICVDVLASNAYREEPLVNRHSCVQGQDGEAMCISAVTDCESISSEDKALIIELFIDGQDGPVQLESFSFVHNAPSSFDWIGGSSGPNNWPSRYIIEIYVDGTLVFSEDRGTENDAWREDSYDLTAIPEMLLSESSTVGISLLAYCETDNEATVSLWDIDDISIRASCPEGLQNDGTISGIVRTDYNEPILDAEIFLQSKDLDSDRIEYSNLDGRYHFSHVPQGLDYRIDAEKADDATRDLSTLDIIHIKKHLLGMVELDSKAKMIAADVDANGTISALDLVEIRRVLLGMDDEFRNNSVWNFYEAGSFEASIDIPEFIFDRADANLLAIKTGDVSYKIDDGLLAAEDRTEKALQLNVMSSLQPDGQYLHSLVVAEDMDIAGYQFALVTGADITITETSFDAVYHEYHGALRISSSWDGQLQEGDILMEMRSAQAQLGLQLAVNALASEVYTPDLAIGKIILRSAESKVYDLSIAPNPVTDQLYVEINALQGESAMISILDIHGKLRGQHQENLVAGKNQLEISSAILDQMEAGAYILRVESPTGQKSVKFIKTL